MIEERHKGCGGKKSLVVRKLILEFHSLGFICKIEKNVLCKRLSGFYIIKM